MNEKMIVNLDVLVNMYKEFLIMDKIFFMSRLFVFEMYDDGFVTDYIIDLVN